jgi:HEPN domain-containing protein
MSVDEGLRVAGEWVAKAENDLRNAAHTLRMPRNCPTETVCFHAQQCVEKYLKGLLTLHGRDYPRTHRIDELLSLLPAGSGPEITEDEQDLLTEYATVTRYPGDYDPIPLAEARAAVRLARRVRRSVRAQLPASVLRPRER